jgi:hypothetical protein
MQSQILIGLYILSSDLELTQTTRSQTSSLPSSQCRTTTVYSIARRSARCTPLSRYFHNSDDIGLWLTKIEDVWCWLNSMVSIGSRCPHTPAWATDKQRPIWLASSPAHFQGGCLMCFFFTGSLWIMLRHQPTKLLLTGMLVTCLEKLPCWQADQRRGTRQEERCNHGPDSNSMDLD